MMKRARSKERFPIGKWAREAKRKREVLVEANTNLQNLKRKIDIVNTTSEVFEKENAIAGERLNELKRKRGMLEDEKAHLPRPVYATPTTLDENNSDRINGISRNLSAKRRKLTFAAAQRIHSSPQSDGDEAEAATANGLWSTLVSKVKPKKLVSLCKKSKKVTDQVIPEIVNESVSSFEKSTQNLVRSVSVLYRGGIASKRKYCSIRSSTMFEYEDDTKKRKRTEFSKGCKVPALLPYKDVMTFVNQQEIGKLNDIPRVSANTQSEKESEEVTNNLLPLVSGYYIDLKERLIQLADLYLYIESKKPFLNWFGKAPGHFLVALGADGAPFGKSNEACAWLISFLNVMERVATPDDNFLICGANCMEDHPSMIQYGKILKGDIQFIESQAFLVRGQNVKFEFKLVPSDMKWISKFSGELPNSATYPSPYANVRKDELSLRGCKLGDGVKWQPWSYNFRTEVVKKVEKFKTGLTKSISQDNFRKKVCTKIADLKSRQEFEPVLGPLVQNAKADSLHVSNNCWGHWHQKFFNHVISKAKIGRGITSVFQLPEDNPLRKHLKALRFDLKCKKLYNKIIRWFREKRSSTNFEYRFTGEETSKLCSGFMHLIVADIGDIDINNPINFVPLSFARMGLYLRNCVSLCSRVSNITDAEVQELEEQCRLYFNLVSLFHHVTLSVWTMGHCVPYHTKQLMTELGVGLGINSMQGREAKHQQLADYASFSLVKNRWEKVFRHEHMCLIWLRKQNPFLDNYQKSNRMFIPEKCFTNDYCFCGLPLSNGGRECKYCNCNTTKMLIACAVKGSLTKDMNKLVKLAAKSGS